MSGAATSGLNWRVASLTARNALTVLPEEVGKFCQVMASPGSIYQAVAAGSGASCWGESEADVTADVADARVQVITRTFDYNDTDVALAANSAAIDFGAALPAGAYVLGVYANVTVAFTDGAAGTFSADVGVSAGDDDRFTPTALDIDGGVTELTQSVLLAAGGTQLAVKITSSVNLNTATAGSFALTVVYFVPTAEAV